MTIKSDKWIRRMAAEHKMIDPFEPGQLKRVPCSRLVFGRAEMEVPSLSKLYPAMDRVPAAEISLDKERGIVSFGTSSYGYDMRVGTEFKVFKNVHCVEIDPKKIDERAFETITADELVVDEDGGRFIRIPPNSFALAHSVERFVIPDNVLSIVLGKSTYARCGVVCNVTPLEPGWEGHVTIEFSNTTPLPARIYANEGVAQVIFFESDERCETTYRDKKGKYQDQPAKVVLPKV
jgi:dCTP deaminase